jgi:pimeloyl-ACP methyl ester carboxylesterase
MKPLHPDCSTGSRRFLNEEVIKMNTNSIYKSTTGRDKILALYDQVLTQWPVPCTHLNIPARYGDTFVIASGDSSAPPLVLLHGSGSNSATWMGDVIEYSKHYRVYAVDMPGEPGKSDPQRFSAQGPAFHEWLEDVRAGLGLEKMILGGISLGAWASIKYAVYQPERVKKLVLIVPAGIYPGRLSFTLRLIVYSLLGEWGRDRVKKFILNGADLSEEADQFLTLTSKYFNYRMEPPLFSDQELQRLTMPVLFLAGENDRMLNTSKTVARLQKLAPDVTVRLYKDDGHVTINKASEVVALLTHISLA